MKTHTNATWSNTTCAQQCKLTVCITVL